MKKVLSLIISISMLFACIPCVAQASEWIISNAMTVSGNTATVSAKILADSLVVYTFYDADGTLIGASSETHQTATDSLSVNCPDGTAKAKAVIKMTTAEKEPQEKKVPKNVMIIGNSFSVDSTRYVHEIAKSMGYDINVHLIQVDGTVSKEAYDVLYDDVKNGGGAYWGYNYNAGDPEIAKPFDFESRTRYDWVKHNGSVKPTAYAGWKWKITDVTSAYDIDLIVLQNFWADGFGLQGYSEADDPNRSFEDTHCSYYVEMAKLLKEIEPNAEIMINSVWANEMGYNIYPAFGSKASKFGFSTDAFGKQSYFYDTMEKYNGQAAIDVGNAVNGGTPIGQFPVGYAVQIARNWQNESGDYHFRTTSRSFQFEDDGLPLQMHESDVAAGRTRLNRDGFHMSVAARYLAGLVWVETLTGKDARECTYIPPQETLSCGGAKKAEGGSATISVVFPVISTSDATVLRDIAHKAVTNFKTRGLNDPSLPLTFENNSFIRLPF